MDIIAHHTSFANNSHSTIVEKMSNKNPGDLISKVFYFKKFRYELDIFATVSKYNQNDILCILHAFRIVTFEIISQII